MHFINHHLLEKHFIQLHFKLNYNFIFNKFMSLMEPLQDYLMLFNSKFNYLILMLL